AAGVPVQPGDGRRGGGAVAARTDGPGLRRVGGDLERRVRGAREPGAVEPSDRARPNGRGEASVRLFGVLSVRFVHGAGRRSLGCRVRPELEQEVVRRQRERARIMAVLLGAFVVLLFLITVAKAGMNW